MADVQAIYEFALHWFEVFDSSETEERDVGGPFGFACEGMRFTMDCGEAFIQEYGKEAFHDPIHFQEIQKSIDDVDLLTSGIFSKWRYITHWTMEDVLYPRNRAWFKHAFARLMELTDPANFIERFEGIAQFIRLESNNICFGLAPEPDEEVEQCLELSDKGLGKILRFNMSSTEGQPESEMDLCIGAEHARKILDAISNYFSESVPCMATDIGTWDLTIINSGAEKKIRQYLIDNNFVDCIIQLPSNLFFGATIATCIMVLKRNKADNRILFIDATNECIKVTNNNKLTDGPDGNIEHIVDAFVSRANVEHFARCVTYEEIVEQDYNLSVSSYVEQEDTREEIDIAKLNKEIGEIVAREQVLRAEIEKIIAELEG